MSYHKNLTEGDKLLTIWLNIHYSSIIWFLKEMKPFIQRGSIKLIETETKDIYKDKTISISQIKTFYSLKHSKTMYHGFHKNMNLFSNVSWTAYYYDFWRSCDTEDWSNDAENTVLPHRNTYFKIYSNKTIILNSKNNISQYVLTVFLTLVS